MRSSISFKASSGSRRPREAVRHLYHAGLALPVARRLVTTAEGGGLACEAFQLLPGNGGLLISLAACGYDATM